jgi:hypothetical protein
VGELPNGLGSTTPPKFVDTSGVTAMTADADYL